MNEMVPAGTASPFDAIRREDEWGEWWSARDLQAPLGYDQWRRFEDAIERAVAAAQNSGHAPEQHFCRLRQESTGPGRPGVDYRLSRYGCYLIAMNGDPRKAEIAAAQSYFATKTRQAEIAEQADPPTELEMLLVQVRRAVELERVAKEHKARIDGHDQALARHEARLDSIEHNTDMVTVLAFRKLHPVSPPLADAQLSGIGTRCANKYRRQFGTKPPQARDQRYGTVGLYPEWMIREALQDAGYHVEALS